MRCCWGRNIGGFRFSIFEKPIQAQRSNSDSVIPGWSAGPDPESRDSGFDASHRPGMTVSARIPNMTSRPRDALRPSCAFIFRPFEGVGNAGCPLHPRSRVHFVLVERTRVTTSTPESPGIPARNGFNAYVVLSPVTGLFCHRRLADIVLSKPGWADATPQNLTPASGRQDHTILPYAAIVSRPRAGDRSRVFRLALQSRRTQNAAASTATHPAFVTIMIRPSCGVGWREFVEMICPTGEAKYFCKRDSTGKLQRRPTRLGKNSDYRAGVARSVTTANHSAMLAWNAFKTSGIERRAEPRPLSRATRAFSAMYATKRSKPRMLSMRVKL